MKLLVLFLAAGSLWGQPLNPAQRYELFQKNLAERAAAITADQFAGISGLDDWKKRRPEVKRQFLDMLGLQRLSQGLQGIHALEQTAQGLGVFADPVVQP